MDETYAATLFEKKLGVQATREDINQLTQALDFMPLAIVQAAVYIKQRSPRLSIVSYEEEFRKSNHQKTRLLHYNERDHRRDLEASNSILTTWQISFDYIQEIRPAAADLLSLMSFFDRQGIPESLLREGKEMTNNVGRSSTLNKDQTGDRDHSASESIMDTFEDDLLVLRDYSLISISADETNFEIHQLVQLAIQEWLKAQGKLEMWKDCFIQKLSRKLSDATFENWQDYQLLFAHVQSAVTHQPVSKDSLENWASLLYAAAWFANTRGDYINCQEMAEIAKATRMRLFGPEDERTLSSFEQLGSTYTITGQWLKAEELQLFVLNTHNKFLGPKHHKTLDSMTGLVSTYRVLGMLKQAEVLQKQVVDTRQQVLGPKDLATISSRGYLASIYNDQGRWKEAESLHEEVVSTCQQVLGLEDCTTLNGMDALAFIYRNQGRLKQAEALQVQVLHTRKKVLGQKHLETGESMRDLGWTYYNQGRLKEAEELWLQALDLNQQILGPRHRSTLNIMVNLASTYHSQGRWKEAEELQVRVLNIRKQDLGPEHRETLASMTYRPSKALQVQVLDTRMQALGLEYHDTLDSRAYQPPEALQMQVLNTSKQVFGPEHPNTLNSMTNLASTYHNQGQWKEAEELQVQVLEIHKKTSPWTSCTLQSMRNLALNYYNQGRWEEAEELQVQLVDAYKQSSSPEHPDSLASMNNLAFTRWSLGQEEDALLLMTECARLFDRNLGSEHPLSESSKYALQEWHEIVVSPSLRYIPRHMSATTEAFPITFGLTSI